MPWKKFAVYLLVSLQNYWTSPWDYGFIIVCTAEYLEDMQLYCTLYCKTSLFSHLYYSMYYSFLDLAQLSFDKYCHFCEMFKLNITTYCKLCSRGSYITAPFCSNISVMSWCHCNGHYAFIPEIFTFCLFQFEIFPFLPKCLLYASSTSFLF